MRYKDMCGGKLRVYENGAVSKLINGAECVPTITNTGGYATVSLLGKNHLIHRLVAEAFIPNPDNKPQVNHKDGNKRHDSVDNLEWVTASENMLHAYLIGLMDSSSRRVHLPNLVTANTALQATLLRNIFKRCNEKQTTLCQLEKKARVSNGSISRWAKHMPSATAVKRVADVLGVTVDELLREEDGE